MKIKPTITDLKEKYLINFYYPFYLPVFLLFGVSIIFFFNLTVDDAFITFKYAENLVNIGKLVFNNGETINALTSPFQALLSSVLFYVTGHTVLSNKILALSLLLISSLLIWRRYNNRPELQILTLLLVMLSSCVLLWTFGGLETSLLLFIATITTLLIDRDPSIGYSKSLWIIFFLAGLGFLTRYDSVLFFAPAIVYSAFKSRSIKHVLVALVTGAVLPAAWLIISVAFYGDILPASFYIKTPSTDISVFLKNGEYIISYLLYTGIIPALLAFFLLPLSIREKFKVFRQNIKTMWWLYLGVLLELLYGLSMATSHMMFSFRFFVPYLPATAIIVVDLIGLAAKTTKGINLQSGRVAAAFKVYLVCLLLFQGYQIYYTYNKSVNGLSRVGEYQNLSARDYIKFIDILRMEAEDIRNHWNNISKVNHGSPRVYTYAEGMLPYTYQDAYIYGRLVSYQGPKSTKQDLYDYGLPADYIQIIVPRHGKVKDQLPKPVENYILISSYKLYFDGARESFLVYYNPNPEHP